VFGIRLSQAFFPTVSGRWLLSQHPHSLAPPSPTPCSFAIKSSLSSIWIFTSCLTKYHVRRNQMRVHILGKFRDILFSPWKVKRELAELPLMDGGCQWSASRHPCSPQHSVFKYSTLVMMPSPISSQRPPSFSVLYLI